MLPAEFTLHITKCRAVCRPQTLFWGQTWDDETCVLLFTMVNWSHDYTCAHQPSRVKDNLYMFIAALKKKKKHDKKTNVKIKPGISEANLMPAAIEILKIHCNCFFFPRNKLLLNVDNWGSDWMTTVLIHLLLSQDQHWSDGIVSSLEGIFSVMSDYLPRETFTIFPMLFSIFTVSDSRRIPCLSDFTQKCLVPPSLGGPLLWF